MARFIWALGREDRDTAEVFLDLEMVTSTKELSIMVSCSVKVCETLNICISLNQTFERQFVLLTSLFLCTYQNMSQHTFVLKGRYTFSDGSYYDGEYGRRKGGYGHGVS
jgi:hypothetical protein